VAGLYNRGSWSCKRRARARRWTGGERRVSLGWLRRRGAACTSCAARPGARSGSSCGRSR